MHEHNASCGCRNADLETILATDLNQLGQVPKLQALAISALRSRLLLELEGLITTQQASGGKSITSAYNKAKQVLTPSPSLASPPLFSFVAPSGCDRDAGHRLCQGHKCSGLHFLACLHCMFCCSSMLPE